MLMILPRSAILACLTSLHSRADDLLGFRALFSIMRKSAAVRYKVHSVCPSVKCALADADDARYFGFCLALHATVDADDAAGGVWPEFLHGNNKDRSLWKGDLNQRLLLHVRQTTPFASKSIISDSLNHVSLMRQSR